MRYYCSSLGSFAKKLTVKGMQIRLVMTSATACAIWMPVRPHRKLKSRMTGIKHRPFLNDDRKVALNL